MVFKRSTISLGDMVKITVEIETFGGTFTDGHEFRVVGTNDRGYDLEDNDGNRCGEVPAVFLERMEGD